MPNLLKRLAGAYLGWNIGRQSIPDDIELLGLMLSKMALGSNNVRRGSEPSFSLLTPERHSEGFYKLVDGALNKPIFVVLTSDYRKVAIEYNGKEIVKVSEIFYRRMKEHGKRFYITTLKPIEVTQKQATILLDSLTSFTLDNDVSLV